MTRRPLLAIAAVALLSFAARVSAAGDAVGLVASADPVAGARLFLRCKACHTTEKGGSHRLGPNLWGVVGRDKATLAGFGYSPALTKLPGVWDYAALDGYLENPGKFAPGNRMAFPGLKDAPQRAAVIAYLRTLSDSPPPPPKAAAAAPPFAAPAAPSETDDFDGLPPGAGREETHAICGACHSLKLVTQQGLGTERWDELMDWMTEKQGMAELPKVERQRIVRYLARHFGPDRRARQRADPMRPAMPAMPMMAPAMPPPPP